MLGPSYARSVGHLLAVTGDVEHKTRSGRVRTIDTLTPRTPFSNKPTSGVCTRSSNGTSRTHRRI